MKLLITILKKFIEDLDCVYSFKNSTQPSGQSVSLQCMSVGVPVLISKTDGFWDYDLFKDNKNIFFG